MKQYNKKVGSTLLNDINAVWAKPLKYSVNLNDDNGKVIAKFTKGDYIILYGNTLSEANISFLTKVQLKENFELESVDSNEE